MASESYKKIEYAIAGNVVQLRKHKFAFSSSLSEVIEWLNEHDIDYEVRNRCNFSIVTIYNVSLAMEFKLRFM